MRRKFYLGFGIVLLAILLSLIMIHHGWWFLTILIPLTFVYLYDFFQTEHTILRNFPVLGHIRFILEFFRPEIQQSVVS